MAGTGCRLNPAERVAFEVLPAQRFLELAWPGQLIGREVSALSKIDLLEELQEVEEQVSRRVDVRLGLAVRDHHREELGHCRVHRGNTLGYTQIADLPDDIELPAVADRQRRAVMKGGLVVEPTLAAAIRPVAPPIAFLDFETVALAVPCWDGCHPYDAVPVQFSVHLLRRDDAPAEHVAFLAEPGVDPRPSLAAALVEVLQGVDVVVAYNMSFERGRIEDLAAAVPALSAELLNINSRVIDLLPLVRDHVAHPDFGGGFKLKVVAPVLAPGSYADVAIHDGGVASVALKRLLPSELEQEEAEPLRHDLLRYCEADTKATMQVWQALRELAGST